MATVPTLTQRLQTQRPSAKEIKQGTGFSDTMVDDYLTMFENFVLLAGSGDGSVIQIAENTENIKILFTRVNALDQNVIDINIHIGLIDQSIIDVNVRVDLADLAIIGVQNNLTTHENNDSAHGVTGDNVGTGNYCTLLLGGVVDLAGAVTNAVDSNVDVVSPSVPAAAATYTQADIETMVVLLNEQKASINQLTTDLNAVVTQLNEVITNSKTAKQMAS